MGEGEINSQQFESLKDSTSEERLVIAIPEVAQSKESEKALIQQEAPESIVTTLEVVPLNMQFPMEIQEEPVSPISWIKQHIIKLSSEFGVDFRGCEEKAEDYS